jgi:hypothetical protein
VLLLKTFCMQELSTGWKLFRVACILQMIAVGLQLIFNGGRLFHGNFRVHAVIAVLVYGLNFAFLYQALSILNYNYPDTPLSGRQKKSFNWLYLLNFLCITFLFADLVREWKSTVPFLDNFQASLLIYLMVIFPVILTVFIFIFHIVFLVGMYNLRRLIYKNTVEKWQDQFVDPG